ncbi:hypothetical protein GCM10010174_42390 [Kutzneria viridogrisea]|uniref:Uncharacterized protein n=1 Tax=Kutzneria viridogrisea TaxID=47990 RepID=A0ABR6BVJ1_9PSEU|nr:hypothetical protein [Kutzneria viridogrisea]
MTAPSDCLATWVRDPHGQAECALADVLLCRAHSDREATALCDLVCARYPAADLVLVGVPDRQITVGTRGGRRFVLRPAGTSGRCLSWAQAMWSAGMSLHAWWTARLDLVRLGTEQIPVWCPGHAADRAPTASCGGLALSPVQQGQPGAGGILLR